MFQKNSVNLNDKKVVYWETNKTAPLTAIFIHGLGGDHRGLEECTRNIKNIHIVMPDLPGYGVSEPLSEDHNFKNYANVIEMLRQKLNKNKIIIAGHSFGSVIAMYYAKEYSTHITKLILLNPVANDSDTLSARFGNLFARLAFKMPDKVCHFLLSNKLTVYVTDAAIMTRAGRAYRHKILSEDYENYKRASTKTLKDSIEALAKFSLAHINPENNIETYILTGNKDSLVTPESIQKISHYFQCRRIESVPGGHLLPMEQPDIAGKIISQFLS